MADFSQWGAHCMGDTTKEAIFPADDYLVSSICKTHSNASWVDLNLGGGKRSFQKYARCRLFEALQGQNQHLVFDLETKCTAEV